jgi:hypothetical protein
MDFLQIDQWNTHLPVINHTTTSSSAGKFQSGCERGGFIIILIAKWVQAGTHLPQP